MHALARNGNFRIYFCGRIVSTLGDSFYNVALIVAILQATHDVTAGALVLAAGAIPVVVLTLLGGVIGDRFPRNRVMLASDLVRALAQGSMAALLLHGSPPLWALVLTQLCYGIGDAFFDPASTGIVPEIVSAEALPSANGILSAVGNTALVLGPALAGIAIAIAGAPVAIACDGITFGLSAISLAFLRLPARSRDNPRASIGEQLRDGFAEVRRRSWLLTTVCYIAVLTFAFNGTMFVLGPAIALAHLGGPSAWAAVLAAFGAGLIPGSFLAIRVAKSRRALWWAYVGNLAVVPLLLLFGSSRSTLWEVAVASSFAGIAVAVFGVTYPTILQQIVPQAMLSRVGSYRWLARVAAMPLAFAIVGPLARRFGISSVMIAAAVVVMGATCICVGFREIWAMRVADNDAHALR